ncbi:6804_t:CDS:2 [Ambispora gerdemannii]|uniref:6804_t:CDS:1 n=1 Tax=Ambispora gerdemannii TaxID=144530 RepID=A0A9N8WFC7_9GLOM|nr:6804_t:CDS:2 [Ambispora gerdemannii]
MSSQTMSLQQNTSTPSSKSHNKRDSGFAEFFETAIIHSIEEQVRFELPYSNYLGISYDLAHFVSKQSIHEDENSEWARTSLENVLKPVKKAPEVVVFKREIGIFTYWHTWTRKIKERELHRQSQKRKIKKETVKEGDEIKNHQMYKNATNSVEVHTPHVREIFEIENRITKSLKSINSILTKINGCLAESKNNAEQMQKLLNRIKSVREHYQL